jgi:hypothetical protein
VVDSDPYGGVRGSLKGVISSKELVNEGIGHRGMGVSASVWPGVKFSRIVGDPGTDGAQDCHGEGDCQHARKEPALGRYAVMGSGLPMVFGRHG